MIVIKIDSTVYLSGEHGQQAWVYLTCKYTSLKSDNKYHTHPNIVKYLV